MRPTESRRARRRNVARFAVGPGAETPCPGTHCHRGTRIGHYAATAIASTAVAASIALQAIRLTALGIGLGIVLGYAIALAAHRLGDGSKSLVTVNPVWGAIAGFKMCWLALTGGLATDLAQHVEPSREHPIGRMIGHPR